MVDLGFEPRSDQTKYYKMVCAASPLSTTWAALRRKIKDWLDRNHDNVPVATCPSADSSFRELAL